MRDLIVISLAVTIALAVAHVAPAQQPASFRPSDLIGEWEGEWRTATSSGAVYLTIKKVEGDKVLGTSYTQGTAKYHNRYRDFAGALQGDVLSGSNPTLPGQPPLAFEWKISEDGKTMEGWSHGTSRSTVTLKKKK